MSDANTAEISLGAERSQTVRDQMVREMGVTKGCRFNAAKRLETLEKRRTVTIAAASIFVILLSLIPAMVPLPALLANLLTLITVGFSIIILVASILQAANSDSVKADQLHRCSLEINGIRHELRAVDSPDEAILKTFSRRYQEILQRYSVNHDDVDFEKYKIDHPNLYPTVSEAEKGESLRNAKRLDVLSTLAGALSIIGAVAAAIAISYDTLSDLVLKLIQDLPS